MGINTHVYACHWNTWWTRAACMECIARGQLNADWTHAVHLNGCFLPPHRCSDQGPQSNCVRWCRDCVLLRTSWKDCWKQCRCEGWRWHKYLDHLLQHKTMWLPSAPEWHNIRCWTEGSECIWYKAPLHTWGRCSCYEVEKVVPFLGQVGKM